MQHVFLRAAWGLSAMLGIAGLAVSLLGVASAGTGIVRFLAASKGPVSVSAPVWRDPRVRLGIAAFIAGLGLQVVIFVLRLVLPGGQ